MTRRRSSSGSRSSGKQSLSVGSLIALLIIGAIVYGCNALQTGTALPEPISTLAAPIGTLIAPLGTVIAPVGTLVGNVPGAPGGMPDLPAKPQLSETTYKGCPPQGDGGDTELNRLKNRVDESNYIPVQFDAFEQLPWPPAIEQRTRSRWSAADKATVGKYEGIPVAIDGYLAGAREEGPEATNCHGADYDFHDFHLWLTKTAGEDRTRSIVVEVTPRIRERHASWTIPNLTRLMRDKLHLRISGWTMLDPEHPDQLNKTRGTIWEIHPIMQIEVEQQGRWTALDQFAK